MVQPKTVPIQLEAVPVQTLRVRVVRGADAGLEKTLEGDVLTVGTALGNDLVLTDPTVSRFHLELRCRADRVCLKDLGSTNGTALSSARLQGADLVLPLGSTLVLGETELLIGPGEVRMRAPPSRREGTSFRGRSRAVRQVLAAVERVAGTDAPVLLLGESGTGKELLARELHALSHRASAPFVVVDCGALTPSLFTSELFGHEKGAFTGADTRYEGAFERAKGGTVLLDEVGELPAPIQAALLGALERRCIRRVGGRTDIPVDLRVLGATHRDLRAQVNEGSFRLDLFYRLAVVTIEAPPLRERREDVRPLLEHFLELAGHPGPLATLFPDEMVRRLELHDWPGNVRELRNLVVSAVALGAPPGVGEATRSPEEPGPATAVQGYREARAALLREFERSYLTALLRHSGGNVRQAARDAQMDRSYLIELLRRHGLG